MMRAPWFWRENTIAARVVATGLTPLSALYDLAQQTRWKITKPATTPVPVICVGNATLGGVGKTPFAIALAKLLGKDNAICFLTRGYGGALRGPVKVDLSTHDVDMVGDEALLLARYAPVWVSKDRVAGANAAAADGADLIIMDDGFQNPTIEKTVSILLTDIEQPAANQKIFPAGPFREPFARASSRADIIIQVAQEEPGTEHEPSRSATAHTAWLEPADPPAPCPVVAFSGIGDPQKFFATLAKLTFDIKGQAVFADHYRFTQADLVALKKRAKENKAQLITTEKDYVRLPKTMRDEVLVLPVEMHITKPTLLAETIAMAIEQFKPPAKSDIA